MTLLHRRSARQGAWLEAIWRDVRYGLRQVRRNPSFSAIAIATLALGIGGTTAMFSVFDAVLVRPLPYADADRLVMVWDWETGETDVTSRHNSTPAEWIEWRRLNTVFTDLACTQPADATLSGDGEPELVPARKVTWTFWSVLGVQPMLGRVFTEDEDNKGVRVVVISHGLWQRRFGGASDVVGRAISLNDEPYEVIGVMPRNFYFMPSREIDMWMPASFPPWMRTNLTWHDAQIVARLKPGVTVEHAQQSMAALSLQVTAKNFRGPRSVIVAPLRAEIAGRTRTALILLLSASACAPLDRLRQSDESAALARRNAGQGSRGARGTRCGARQAGVPVSHRKPGARRARHAGRTRDRPSGDAISRTARARGHGRRAPHARLARAGILRRRGYRIGIDVRTRARATGITSRSAGSTPRWRTRHSGRAQPLVPAFADRRRNGARRRAADMLRPAPADLSAPAQHRCRVQERTAPDLRDAAVPLQGVPRGAWPSSTPNWRPCAPFPAWSTPVRSVAFRSRTSPTRPSIGWKGSPDPASRSRSRSFATSAATISRRSARLCTKADSSARRTKRPSCPWPSSTSRLPLATSKADLLSAGGSSLEIQVKRATGTRLSAS